MSDSNDYKYSVSNLMEPGREDVSASSSVCHLGKQTKERKGADLVSVKLPSVANPSTCTSWYENETLLVKRMLPQTRIIAKRLKLKSRLPKHIDLDDLIQAGIVGLLEASKRYDPQFGATFETYASRRIQGAMIDELRSSDWLPRSVRRCAREMEHVQSRLEQRYERPVRERDVAAVMEMPMTTYARHKSDVQSGQLLELSENDEDFPAGELVEHDPLLYLLKAEQYALLNLAIDALDDDRERDALKAHHLNGVSLKEIGELMGISDSRVCQIHKRALEKVRLWFFHYYPDIDDFQKLEYPLIPTRAGMGNSS